MSTQHLRMDVIMHRNAAIKAGVERDKLLIILSEMITALENAKDALSCASLLAIVGDGGKTVAAAIDSIDVALFKARRAQP